MNFDLWHQLLTETVCWQDIDPYLSLDILQRTAVAWAHDQKYFMQSGPERVDLTKLYEQYKLLETLKGTYHGEEIDSEHC